MCSGRRHPPVRHNSYSCSYHSPLGCCSLFVGKPATSPLIAITLAPRTDTFFWSNFFALLLPPSAIHPSRKRSAIVSFCFIYSRFISKTTGVDVVQICLEPISTSPIDPRDYVKQLLQHHPLVPQSCVSIPIFSDKAKSLIQMTTGSALSWDSHTQASLQRNASKLSAVPTSRPPR